MSDKSQTKQIRFEHELLEQIEAHKDPLIPFSSWIKQSAREKMQRERAIAPTTAHDQQPEAVTATVKRSSKFKFHTPKGVFDSNNEAATAHDLSPRAMRDRFSNPICTRSATT